VGGEVAGVGEGRELLEDAVVGVEKSEGSLLGSDWAE